MREAKYRSWQPTYGSWARMIKRCTDPKNNRYYRYGDRGITVCKRWLVYENFLHDMGERPQGTSLDRINNDGNYNKRNCRWATFRQQMANTSRTVKVGNVHLAEAARIAGLTHGAIEYRIKTGWKKKDLLRPSIWKDKRYIGATEFCRMAGLSATTYGRIKASGKITPDFVTNGGNWYFLKKSVAKVLTKLEGV